MLVCHEKFITSNQMDILKYVLHNWDKMSRPRDKDPLEKKAWCGGKFGSEMAGDTTIITTL